MIEIHSYVLVILGFFALVGFSRFAGFVSNLAPTTRTVRMDLKQVNSIPHLLALGFTNLSHRDGPPEF
jgi:formate hydrogenlyase subunit 3/multisubunit Na+/H+ antiporter MnhD subunit